MASDRQEYRVGGVGLFAAIIGKRPVEALHVSGDYFLTFSLFRYFERSLQRLE